VIARLRAAVAFFILGSFLIVQQLLISHYEDAGVFYQQQVEAETLQLRTLGRQSTTLPVAKADHKLEALVAYLREKKSPLAKYAGELSRLPNWKVLIAIAQAESGLCKKTARNNCWGIGPNNTPWSFRDISESLYYANYLLSKYDDNGLDSSSPESIVRTYVGYDHPGWVSNVKDTLLELKIRGIE
jgi:hypothetical protein